MHTRIRNLCFAALFAALIAVCTWITVPGAVPFTMQTFAIMAAVGLLGTRRAFLSTLLYLALGCVGLPVFSGFRGGIGVLAGPTGGYLVGFLFSALVAGLLIDRFGDGVLSLFLSMCAGVAVCYLFGTAWFYILTLSGGGNTAILVILSKCVFPFIPFDLAKIALAVFLTRRLKKIIHL